MILGCDVSSLQGSIDWRRVANSGVRFMWSKCSEGNEPSRNDKRFQDNVDGAKDAGVFIGAYHFAYPLKRGAGNDPIEQARRAFSVCGGMGSRPGELPPLFDIEWPAPDQWVKWGVTASSISQWSQTYCEEASRLWRRDPVLYTFPWFWQSLATGANVSWARRYYLNIAHYKHPKEWLPPAGSNPIVPSPWSEWTFWQYSANGGLHLPGIGCDVDRIVYRGTEAELKALCLVPEEPTTSPDLGFVVPGGTASALSHNDMRTLETVLTRDARAVDTWLQSPRGLQIALVALGFSVGPKGVDGYLGQGTKDGVLSFQRALHLNVDGVVGPLTRGALAKALRKLFHLGP